MDIVPKGSWLGAATMRGVARQLGASSDRTVAAANAALAQPRRGSLRQVLPFLGPAFIAAVAYVDPGNFATNIAAGARYGYLLLWVIVASNLIAVLVQMLSAKLGIATGKSLPELCRAYLPRWLSLSLWGVAEIGAMATDLAEFLGAAVGLYLLFHIPLLPAGLLTAVATFAILGLQRFGFRPLEALIGVLVSVIAVAYVVELALARPDAGQVAQHAVLPGFDGTGSVLLAVGILGATVMPHVVYLHSALTRGRVRGGDEAQKRAIFRFERIDILLAMGLAGLINGAMLLMAASVFHANGATDVGSIESAFRTLTPLVGNAASMLFGVALLTSGLSSSAVGTLAGQVIMDGFLGWSIPLWLRRGITMLPALAVIALGLDATQTLVISQVILSFVLPFAVIPLVFFTSRRAVMGGLVNRPLTRVLAWGAAGIIVALNVLLIYLTFSGAA